MAIDDLKRLTTGFIKGWKKGKLKETLKETAEAAIDAKVKVAELEERNRQLLDQIRQLKGEKKKPKFKKKIPSINTDDLNPKTKKPRKKSHKKENLEIDEVIEVSPSDLPKDAKKIGSRKIVVQEILIKRRNICFEIKRYWSESLGRSIEGEIPAEFKGSEFGPQLRSHILYLYYKLRVPHKKIKDYFEDLGIRLSAGFICETLNSDLAVFAEDLHSAKKAALKKQARLHIDETGAKLNGQLAYTFGVSNDYFCQFSTLFGKSRWKAVGSLLNGKESFLFDTEAISFVAKKCKRPVLTTLCYDIRDQILSEQEIEIRFKDATKKQLEHIKTAGSISALRSGKLGPPIKFLISDDATNFKDLIEKHQLCWVHEIRKYKLSEVFKRIESETLEKLTRIWREFYKKLSNYKLHPTKEKRDSIRARFDQICNLKTMVKPLDEQLARTKKLKDKLLLVLRYPQLPLHNNLCENDLRERVIKRKISLQNRSIEGMKAWDLMLSLNVTCRKLNISFFDYLEDRISGREQIKYLGRLINSL